MVYIAYVRHTTNTGLRWRCVQRRMCGRPCHAFMYVLSRHAHSEATNLNTRTRTHACNSPSRHHTTRAGTLDSSRHTRQNTTDLSQSISHSPCYNRVVLYISKMYQNLHPAPLTSGISKVQTKRKYISLGVPRWDTRTPPWLDSQPMITPTGRHMLPPLLNTHILIA